MKRSVKQLLLFSLTGVLIFSAVYVAMCSQQCLKGTGDLPMITTCTATSHSFVHSDMIITSLISLPLLGILLSIIFTRTPLGFHTPPLRPPRHSV
jgi:hypothetical protein